MSRQLETLIYVSRNRLADDDLAAELIEIERVAQSRNRSEQITGVLLFSGCHFLQVLEGPGDSLTGLFQRLDRDHRHSDVRIVLREVEFERRYPDWSMRYAGLCTFALAFFSRLHAGVTSRSDREIIDALVDRVLG